MMLYGEANRDADMYRTSRLKITEISPHLICVLCGGYFIDATSIIECLHSFCKTCIVRYLESSKYCPICDVLVHKTRPLQNIRQDQILQDLVYKLVPGLFKKEMKRRRDYYKKHPVPEFIEQTRKTSKQNGDFQERVIYTEDESISLSLEFSYNGYPPVWGRDEERNKVTDRRYLLCPAAVTLAHLKKFIRMKFSLSDHHKIDIFHTDEILCDSYTLIDIAYIFTWRRQGPLRLFYTVYENPAKRLKMAEPEPTSKPSSENNNSSSGGVGVGVVATSATDGTAANNVGGAIPAANGNPPTESQQPDRRGAGGATKTEAVPEPSALEGVRAGTPRAVPISAELSSQRAKEPREIVFNGQMVVNGHEPGIVDTSVIKTEPLIADGLSVTS